MQDANEIQEILGRTYGTPEVDEADLEAELDALVRGLFDKKKKKKREEEKIRTRRKRRRKEEEEEEEEENRKQKWEHQ